MKRVIVAVGLFACGTLGACSSGAARSAAVSIANLSDTSLRIEATLENGADALGESVAQVDLAPGTSGGFSLAIPEGGADRGVEFRVEPVGGGAPTILTMSPPGPYLLRVSGFKASLKLEREIVEADTARGGLRGVPADPTRRTWGGGIQP